MNTKLFYDHEADSIIMMKKDKAEIENWIAELEFMNNEIEYLMKIEHKILNNTTIRENLLMVRRENTLILGILYKYEANQRNIIECDTMKCNAFYLNNHEKNRNSYLKHIHRYRELKLRILSKISSYSSR